MKKKLIIGCLFFFLLITNIIFISSTIVYKTKIDKQEFKVYSFEGEDKNIRISSGIIIISPSKQTVSGGKIQYIGNKHENIQSYSKNIYLNKKGNKHSILLDSVSFEDENKRTTFLDEFLLNENLGQISSEKLFTEEDIKIIKDNLYFSLNYLTADGQSGNFIVKLKVKEFGVDKNRKN